MKDILVSVLILVIAGYFIWFKLKNKPSDKYYNDSWKTRKR